MDERLSAIFSDETGKLPDLNTIERRRFPIALVIVVGVIAFLGFLSAAIWAGSGLWRPFASPGGGGLELNIEGPERISLGQEVTYFINWRNLSSAPLAAVDVRASFPPEFSMTSIEPRTPTESMDWRLGSVAVGARGTFTVRGIFTGSLGKQTAVQAVGNYRPATFNSDFEALATRSVTYAETVVEGVIDLPPKALSGDKFKVSYTVENKGTVPLKNLELRLTLPKEFIRDAVSGTGLDERLMRVSVGDMAAGATATIAVSGTYAAGVTGNIPWHAELGRQGDDGTFQAVHSADAEMAVLGGDLSLKLVANGAEGDRSISYGDQLRFTLGYENSSPEELKDVVLRLRFEPTNASGTVIATSTAGPFVEWDKLDMSPNGSTSTLPTLVWDKETLGELERLSSRQDGTVEFALPAVSVASSSLSGFQVTAEAVIGSVGKVVLNRTIRTAPMLFRFRSDADITAEARYFSEEGAPLGSGPLPPLLGQNTTYRIRWDLTKHLHELKDIVVSASLPKNVTWPAKVEVSAGAVTYDESTRKVMWTLNRLPADVDGASAEFDVQLTPAEFDVGRFADLMGDTRFEATDALLDEPIIKTKPGLGTDLRDDEGAKNKGVVRRP